MMKQFKDGKGVKGKFKLPFLKKRYFLKEVKYGSRMRPAWEPKTFYRIVAADQEHQGMAAPWKKLAL